MRNLRICFLACVQLPVCVSVSQAATIVISEDTTISDNRFDDDFIRVVAGANGPTTVRIVEGATVRGFGAEGDSHVILDGGVVGFLSALHDNARFTILSGKLACVIECAGVEDVAGYIVAHDNSEILYYDGVLWPFYMTDTSELNVYGIDLEKTILSESESILSVSITGTTINGNLMNFNGEPFGAGGGLGFLSFFARPAVNIILHEVPEPTSVIAAILPMCILIAIR